MNIQKKFNTKFLFKFIIFFSCISSVKHSYLNEISTTLGHSINENNLISRHVKFNFSSPALFSKNAIIYYDFGVFINMGELTLPGTINLENKDIVFFFNQHAVNTTIFIKADLFTRDRGKVTLKAGVGFSNKLFHSNDSKFSISQTDSTTIKDELLNIKISSRNSCVNLFVKPIIVLQKVTIEGLFRISKYNSLYTIIEKNPKGINMTPYPTKWYEKDYSLHTSDTEYDFGLSLQLSITKNKKISISLIRENTININTKNIEEKIKAFTLEISISKQS